MVEKNKRKKHTAGFTFVELIVAVAIMAVALTPIMSALVMSSRMNLKGRRKEQALTVAQNLMEGVKAFGITEVLLQCDESSSTFRLIPDNSEGTKISHKITKNETNEKEVDIDSYDLMNGTTIENVTITFEAKDYEIELENILMGSTYYDATITITPNLNTDYIVSYYYDDIFTKAGMSNLKYYDAQVEVKMHGETEVLSTYNGTFLDQN
jgi:prepilin-type N-terminal cleavage/methylation domain-containing protein